MLEKDDYDEPMEPKHRGSVPLYLCTDQQACQRKYYRDMPGGSQLVVLALRTFQGLLYQLVTTRRAATMARDCWREAVSEMAEAATLQVRGETLQPSRATTELEIKADQIMCVELDDTGR